MNPDRYSCYELIDIYRMKGNKEIPSKYLIIWLIDIIILYYIKIYYNIIYYYYIIL